MNDPLSGWQKHNTDDSRLTTISGLTTDITYSLRVLGFTSVGDGPPSDVLQVKTQQGGERGSVSYCGVCILLWGVLPVLLCPCVLTLTPVPPVPAQPSSFEAEAELDTRIMLTWLWPVQDTITKYELQYWEANSDNKVGKTRAWIMSSSSVSLVSQSVSLHSHTLYCFAGSSVTQQIHVSPHQERAVPCHFSEWLCVRVKAM